ncbi:DNA repair protein Rad60 isoform X4 [Osmia lignaria lignaria]|uniref:DNA repair protein Rad60 isoform X4 n=1 Tax=Osmia lignaria lignaria TaxID=1437193 RepID=UPI00402BD663
MKTEQLGSSSEDDDVYLNAVAVLKALKKKQTLPHSSQKTEEKVEEKPEELKIQIPQKNAKEQRPKRKTSGRRKTAGTSSSRQKQGTSADQDSDLEIVSVEEKSNPTAAADEIDILIVENCVDETSNPAGDENYDLSVKILWRSRNVHRLNIRKNENFHKIFEYFADLEKVSIDEILITKKDQIIKKSDTPASINLSVIDILEGGIVKKDSTTPQNYEENDENTCVIKVQTTTKKTITVSVKRDENFQVLSVKCAQALDVEESKIKLYFDGELITLTDTPDSLEIEDEACFDLKLAS